MKEPVSPSTRLLPVPATRVIYALLTDHYPWSEVRQDLELRPQLSGVLEVRHPSGRAQALWDSGEFLGAYGQEDLSLDELPRRFPRALLRLYEAPGNLTRMAWSLRHEQPRALAQPWPQAGAELTSGAFEGALIGSRQEVSYWQGGAPIAGQPPAAGPVYALGQSVSAGALRDFWNEALRLAARQDPAIRRAWEQSALALAGQYPCFDPFLREVWLQGEQLQVGGAEVSELRPALRAAFLEAAQRIQFPLAALQPLRTHPLWRFSGLGEAL